MGGYFYLKYNQNIGDEEDQELFEERVLFEFEEQEESIHSQHYQRQLDLEYQKEKNE